MYLCDRESGRRPSVLLHRKKKNRLEIRNRTFFMTVQSWQKRTLKSLWMMMIMIISPDLFAPDFCLSKYCAIFMKFGTHVLRMNTQRAFFSFFRNFPSFPPWGGIPHLEIPFDYLEIWYVCSVSHYLTNGLFSFPKFPPISPPRGDFHPQNLEI